MKLTKSKIRQIIKEELEVILTNEEVGDFFGVDVQRKLEEDTDYDPRRATAMAAVTASEEEGVGGGDVYKIATESNAADAADELTGRIPDAGAQMLEQSIEDLLDLESEFYQGLSDEEDDTKTSPLERAMPSPVVRNVLETILNFILKGRMGEAVDKEGEEPEEEEGTIRTKRVTPQSIKRVKRSIGRRRGVGMGSPRGAASRHKTSQFDR